MIQVVPLHATLHEGEPGDLLPGWAELFAADDRATPFQSPVWMQAWWRHWGRRAQPWLVAVFDADRLVGLAPLQRRRIAGLRLLQGGSEPGDYWDFLAHPDYRADVEALIARELRKRAADWDALLLARVPAGRATADVAERAGFQRARHSLMPCPAIALPGDFDEYLASLPTRRRTNLRRRLRNLDSGVVELRTPAVEELPAAITRWQALRVRQWETMGKRLTREHRRTRLRNFLVEVTTGLVPHRRALVWEFLHGGELVGSFINFCDSRVFYQYLGAFAPEVGHLAIGKIATGEGIRSSIAQGRVLYDFGRGSEDYKYWYGAVDQLSSSTLLTHRRWRSALAGRAAAFVPGFGE